jgi:hypothetical protein
MRKLFYLGVVALVLFELANVYFIMPMPFSQRTRSIDVAYFLYSWRWIVRALCGAMILTGALAAWRTPDWRRWLMPASLVLASGVGYALNFRMSADHMFLQPTSVVMRPAERSRIDSARLVVGIEVNGDARAYPVQLIGYHHQVRDMVGGTPVLVSFCTVCRTGRVFSPIVDGRAETFRLVGMDHFNAMFEDSATGSWWRQANGEAIIGPSKGKALAEIPSRQVTLARWLVLHPKSLVMQPDSTMRDKYAKDFDYETGTSRKTLTGTDTISWREKAWVVGLTVDGESRAYDWNRLRREGVVNDVLGGRPVVLVLASDRTSFFAFERPAPTISFALRSDSLVAGAQAYALSGRGHAGVLKSVSASQEFWHSWRTFHPGTTTY